MTTLKDVIKTMLENKYGYTQVTFQMKDAHAYYYDTPDTEIKVVIDDEMGYEDWSVEERPQGREDWDNVY